MSDWKIIPSGKVALKDPVLLVGLPGIGNVGKVAVDFIVDKTGAKKIMDIYSNSFPHSVFVTEENLVDLPVISLYAKPRKKGSDLLILAGDVQPTDEEASYDFSEKILEIIGQQGCKEIITLGGIGLPSVPKTPKVYITGNSKEAVDKYAKGTSVEKNLYGVVGPIIGISGLLLGLSKAKKIPAVCFLAETYGHPMYLGMKGSREIVSVLNKQLDLGLKVEDMDEEIKAIEQESQGGKVDKPASLKKLQDKMVSQDVNYIG